MSGILLKLRKVNARYTPAGVILLTLLILSGTVVFTHRQLREVIRQQITDTHAQVLYALWQELSSKGAGESDFTDDPADQLFTALETTTLSQLKGVLVTRLFDAHGKIITVVPPTAADSEIRAQDFSRLQALAPVSRFYPRAKLDNLFLAENAAAEDSTSPLLEIAIPLHTSGENRLRGVAQYVIDGNSVAAEFKRLDRNLFGQGSIVFLAGGTILVIGLGLAFHHLQRANHLLSERTRSLRQANQELALAAKTSAVGAVTAHLIHGLKNPLSGLQQFMTSRTSAPSGGSDTEWQLAASTTRRMQSLVSEIVRVLREENSVTHYEISLHDLAEVIALRVSPGAAQAKVRFETKIAADGMLTNRDANLIILILENLIHNAIQASPRDKLVNLEIGREAGQVVCQVRDEGPGLTERARQLLFTPCQSNKEGGSGIGLSISKQLANYIGADLELKSNEPGRCIFALSLPASVVAPRSEPTVTE